MRVPVLRLISIITLVLAGVLGGSGTATADDGFDFELIEQSYVRTYFDRSMMTSGSGDEPSAVIVVVLDMVDERAAIGQMETILKSMANEDEVASFTTAKVPDLGDAATHYTVEYHNETEPQSGIVTRDGDVLIVVMTVGPGFEEDLPADIARFMIEKGPSDEKVEKDDNGNELTGGWVAAFPTAADIPALEGIDENAVYDLLEDGLYGDFEDTVRATPAQNDDDSD